MAASNVNRVIQRALTDGAEVYARRGIQVEAELESRTTLPTSEPVLDASLYTIFRGLPARLAPGARLRIATHDRAGGDIEVVWEAEELDRAEGDRHPLAQDKAYGDLLELAIAGLETFCRARAGHVETTDDALRRAPGVHRRYFFLIPALQRDPKWRPARS